MPGQDVDGCPTTQKIGHHLGGHLLRIGADSLGDYAVVSGHSDDNLSSDLRTWVAGDSR